MHSTENPWKKLDEKQVYESPWIAVAHQNVLNPAGNPGTYSIVHFKHYAIGIIPLDEHNHTWVVGQYRYPMKMYSWEIPEGGGPVGEDPLESGKRELIEECGIEASEWKLIQQLQLSNAATDEVAFIYLVRGLTFTEARPEENEQLQVKRIPFDELYEWVNKGIVTDSLTVAAVLKVKLLMMEGKI